VQEVGDDPTIALDAGSRFSVSAHGMLGFACLCAPSLRHSLEMSARYQDLVYPLPTVRFVAEPRMSFVCFDASGLEPTVQRFVIDYSISGVWTSLADIEEARPTRVQIDLARPPADATLYEELFGVRPRFGCPADRLGYDNGHLDRPRAHGDAAAFEQCERQCDELLARRCAAAGVSGLVRERLSRARGTLPTMPEVAADLNMSVRTLRRSLTAERTSFRAIVDDVLCQRAEDLLAETSLPVEEVSGVLGYTTPSAFVRAFRRSHRVPPGQWRRTQDRGRR
jgi:AraC-like DNA-binding protein